MRPLDVVRMSLDNWSDAELGALGVGMHKAKEACGQSKPESYSGDDLYDLARLCSFGQDWNAANTAALDYVAAGLDAHRAQAYALSMNALVHINAVDLAVGTAREMMRKLPYDAEVAYAVRYMKETLEQAGDPAAHPVSHGDRVAARQAEEPDHRMAVTHGGPPGDGGCSRVIGVEDQAAAPLDLLGHELTPVRSSRSWMPSAPR